MRSRTDAILTFVVVTSLLLPAGVAANDEAVTLTVSVVDLDGAPVGAATVEATWDGGETTARTASNGRVFVDVPSGADIELDIDDNRYVRNRPLTVPNATEREVELRAFPAGIATVTVVDDDNETISGATVAIRRNGETVATGRTNEDGRFQTEAIERGEYRISTIKPGFYRERTELTIGEETESTIALEAGRVRLDIEVIDNHFEPPEPLSDARVRIDADVFDADVSVGDGTASLSVPVNARYRITAVKDGYEGTPRLSTVGEEPRSVTVTASRIPELVTTASNRRVVVGETTRIKVRNAYDEPASGVTIRVDGDTVGETDDRGELAVRIDTVGERTIRASDNRTDSEPITVEGIDPDAEAATETPSPTDAEAPAADPEDTPGFGIVTAALALLIAFAVVEARKR